MGLLKPGVQYIYEYEDDVVYAREPNGERFVIGWKYVPADTQDNSANKDEPQT